MSEIQTTAPPTTEVGFRTSEGFALIQRQAQLLASSDLVPKAFQGNVANCVIGLEIANRIGASPLSVLQNLYIVHGKPGWSSQFIIGAVNATGRYSPLRFQVTGEGDAKTCVAWATELATGERLESPPASIQMAKSEGWYAKNGSKWKTMPDLMLRYRAATFFGRLYAPEILMGMQTADEAADVGSQETRKADVAGRFAEKTTLPAPTTAAELVNEPDDLPDVGEVVQTMSGEGTVVKVGTDESGPRVLLDVGTGTNQWMPASEVMRTT